MLTNRLILAFAPFIVVACAAREPAPAPASSPPTLTAGVTCPCAASAAVDGGPGCAGRAGDGMGMMGDGRPAMMMHEHGGPMMHGGPMSGGMMGSAASARSLSADAKAALLRALDDEYRAEALYAHLASRLGPKPPLAILARSEHRRAWVLESLALAHGLELPSNPWTATKQPDIANASAACRAGIDAEKKTIATYDDLLKIDLPADLRKAFTNLRAASVDRHLPGLEACK